MVVHEIKSNPCDSTNGDCFVSRRAEISAMFVKDGNNWDSPLMGTDGTLIINMASGIYLKFFM